MATAVRQRSLIVPREHGAWGILLIPLVTGAVLGLISGGDGWNLIPLTVLALSLFWLRTPLESWTGASPIRARAAGEFALVRKAVLILSAVSAGALVWLFWGGRNRGLLWIGGAAATCFAVQALLKYVRRDLRTAAQMIGAAGLTATAPAAYYVVTRRWDGTWPLWAANELFAINQIHFVQLRIRAAQVKSRSAKFELGRTFFAGQVLATVLLAAACALRAFPWLAAAAFVPVLCRGFAWFAAEPRPLAIHTLGKSQLAYAITFGVLLIAGMAMA